MKVYICSANTGAWSEYEEVTLHGYMTEREAIEFVEQSTRLSEAGMKKCEPLRGNALGYSKAYWDALRSEFPPGWHPGCPQLSAPSPEGWEFTYEAVEIMPLVTVD